MKKKVAVLTTVYPMNESFLYDFFMSLSEQNCHGFDVVVVNDGYKNFSEIIGKFKAINIIELKCNDTVSKNREYGIRYVVSNHYDVLIFGDSDDCFPSNRVRVLYDYLEKFDIVVNDISLFDDSSIYSENYMSNRIANNTEIDLEFVKNKNIFGLTNTAVNTSKLQDVTFDSDLVAVDWYLFSKLLSDGCSAVFTNETQTYYRQHENSEIGIGSISTESIRKGVDVEIKHYQ